MQRSIYSRSGTAAVHTRQLAIDNDNTVADVVLNGHANYGSFEGQLIIVSALVLWLYFTLFVA